MRVTGIIVAIVGALAIAFGVIWTTTVFPRFERIPADFSRTDEFTGSYTVVDPLVQRVQGNAAIQQLRASPATLALLADPSAQQFLSSDAFRQLVADPARLQAALTNPSALQQLVPSPNVARLLADPAVQQLLKDPAALQLLGDPRTLSLLADPAALPVVKVPVQLHRERKATGSEGDKLFLNEQVTTIRTDTGQALEGFPETSVNLVVDRRTSQYLDGTEGNRTGGLGLPFRVEADKSYQVYLSAARAPLEARYLSAERVQGLEVMVFAINEKDRPMGTHPELKLPLALDSNITLRAEPRSGRIVDIEDHATTISVVHPQRGKLPVFVSDIELTEDSVAAQIAEGKSDRGKLIWLGSYMPWMVMGLGIALVLGGAGLGWLRQGRKGQEPTKPLVAPQ